MDGARCPRCGSPLVVRTGSDLTIGACRRCAGIWLDNRGCHLLVSGFAPERLKQALQSIDTLPASADPVGYRVAAPPASPTCPACGAELELRVTDEARQGIRIQLDLCRAHGTWFDRHEAWTLLQAVELKQLALVVELEAADAERAWQAREAAWSSFLSGALLRSS